MRDSKWLCCSVMQIDSPGVDREWLCFVLQISVSDVDLHKQYTLEKRIPCFARLQEWVTVYRV